MCYKYIDPSENFLIIFFQRRIEMKLTPPTQVTFWISVVLGLLGLLGNLGVVAALAPFAFWFAFVGLLLLALGLLIKGI